LQVNVAVTYTEVVKLAGWLVILGIVTAMIEMTFANSCTYTHLHYYVKALYEVLQGFNSRHSFIR